MNCSLAYVWDEELRQYDFGPGHPLSPIRTALAYRLTEYCGVLERPNVTVIKHVDLASPEDIERVHDPEYTAAVKRASDGSGFRDLSRGLGTDDVPIFAGMHEAAARVCGATLAATRSVHSGRTQHAVNIAGGLHHAMPGSASGFCIYNDPGVAIAWLLAQGVERVGYVDVDVHHGDGVQEIFYDDPRVMTVSVHESGRTLFPGTGRAEEVGGPNARGTSVNLALPAGTGDDAWLRAFDAVVPDVLRAFRPQILITQQGCDSHRNDPLANLELSIEGQRASYLRIHDLAHELCAGRWVALGGGGYDWLDAVPRAWTHLAAIAAGAPIDPTTEVPSGYQTLVTAAFGSAAAFGSGTAGSGTAPTMMGDGVRLRDRPWSAGYDPLDRVDRAVLRVHDHVYPLLGLIA